MATLIGLKGVGEQSRGHRPTTVAKRLQRGATVVQRLLIIIIIIILQ
jgi:hypothetical protein